MKAIINGVRYDSEKAGLIGKTSANCSRRDFSWWEAGLYKSPRAGRYFLAGRGGPMSRFSRKIDNSSWSGGEGIEPMTEGEAFAWAQAELSADVVEQHFGHMIEEA